MGAKTIELKSNHVRMILIDPELVAPAYAEVVGLGETHSTPGVVSMWRSRGQNPQPCFYGSLSESHNSFESIE